MGNTVSKKKCFYASLSIISLGLLFWASGETPRNKQNNFFVCVKNLREYKQPKRSHVGNYEQVIRGTRLLAQVHEITEETRYTEYVVFRFDIPRHKVVGKKVGDLLIWLLQKNGSKQSPDKYRCHIKAKSTPSDPCIEEFVDSDRIVDSLLDIYGYIWHFEFRDY